MNTFIHEDFLLGSKAACRLYHDYAAGEPIFDYHCHLSPLDLANNRRFPNLNEIWLEGDHYKWRAMRLHGVDERFCTGDASPREKFDAWAQTVPFTLRNPLYHWTHLELARYFGVHDLLDPQSADRIWNTANDALASDALSSWGILEKFKVRFIGTTDDPTDTLEHHAALRQSACPATVAPSFRPDKGILIQNTATWNTWINQLEAATGSGIDNPDALKAALEARMDHFSAMGCRASDHGLARCPNRIASDTEAAVTFGRVRSGWTPTIEAAEGFAGNLLAFLGASYARRGWVMQLHLGAIRNVNQAIFHTLGTDVGCDSIGDENQITSLATLLGELAARRSLPRTILYNLNPSANYAFATMCGNFFESGIPGKVQFGSGWWFLDQWEGMSWQLNALSSLGLLSHFVGMLTDSRSLMSYCRHEYFRRLLCNLLGHDMEAGVIPANFTLVGNMVKNICYRNAADFFSFE